MLQKELRKLCSSNSVVFASELQENIEEIICPFVHRDRVNKFKSSICMWRGT